jgi:hypothetical protein
MMVGEREAINGLKHPLNSILPEPIFFTEAEGREAVPRTKFLPTRNDEATERDTSTKFFFGREIFAAKIRALKKKKLREKFCQVADSLMQQRWCKIAGRRKDLQSPFWEIHGSRKTPPLRHSGGDRRQT